MDERKQMLIRMDERIFFYLTERGKSLNRRAGNYATYILTKAVDELIAAEEDSACTFKDGKVELMVEHHKAFVEQV